MTQGEIGDKEITLGWLADAPAFIDAEQVAAFYDAVVRPESEQGKIVLSVESLRGSQAKVAGGVNAEISVSAWLKKIFPFLDAKVGGSFSGEQSQEESDKSGQTIELLPISTPQRQLVQLALHYAVNLVDPPRMRIIQEPKELTLLDASFISALPRALIFVDFPGGTKFIPMAAELSEGRVVTFYDDLAKVLKKPDEEALGDFPEEEGEEGDKARADYWRWYAERFQVLKAVSVVENEIGNGGRVRWVAYRVPIEGSDTPIHLMLAGRERFDTGTFAYDLINRGYDHGMRIVGTLRSGFGLRVLAMFDK